MIKNFNQFIKEELGYTNYDVDDDEPIDPTDDINFIDRESEPEFPNKNTTWVVRGDITGDVNISIEKGGNNWETVKEMENFTLPIYSELYHYGNGQFEILFNDVIDNIVSSLQEDKYYLFFYPELEEWTRLIDDDDIEFQPNQKSKSEDFGGDNIK